MVCHVRGSEFCLRGRQGLTLKLILWEINCGLDA